MDYPNLYYSTKSSHEYVEAMTAEVQNGVVPGFSTTSKTRSPPTTPNIDSKITRCPDDDIGRNSVKP